MEDELDILALAGAPVGPPRPPPRSLPSPDALRRAIRQLGRARPQDAEPYVAWLSAFRHHWPSQFEAILGVEGARLLEELRGAVGDENRHLKLRRIAVENLSGIL